MEILFSDNQLVVCIKPVGLDSEQEMPKALQEAVGGQIFPLHRLDKNVGGLMVYARTKAAAATLSKVIQEGQMIKEYVALVHGTPPQADTWKDLLFKDSRKNKVFVVKRSRNGIKAASLEFIQKCGFADMHIFPYSRRPGTPADKMPGQHDNATKEARSKAAIAVAEQMSAAFRKNMIGSVQQVLFEEEEKGYFTGHTGNYMKVYAKGENLHNEVKNVRITGLYAEGLVGEIEEEA